MRPPSLDQFLRELAARLDQEGGGADGEVADFEA